MEADGGDLARLLDAEDVAGAADFEIAHGDFHAAAVAAGFDEGVEPFAGESREACVFGDEEIGIGGAVPAADAAAELVEIGEAIGVGAVDEDGVGVGDVDAVFDDGGGKEDIELALFEAVEDRSRCHRGPSGHGRRRCGRRGRVFGLFGAASRSFRRGCG